MELYLNNVGVIKDSTVILNGLTVVTGKNSSGKTTVGKVTHSLISAGINLDKEFERVEEIPFDSDRKLMTTVHKKGNEFVVYTFIFNLSK